MLSLCSLNDLKAKRNLFYDARRSVFYISDCPLFLLKNTLTNISPPRMWHSCWHLWIALTLTHSSWGGEQWLNIIISCSPWIYIYYVHSNAQTFAVWYVCLNSCSVAWTNVSSWGVIHWWIVFFGGSQGEGMGRPDAERVDHINRHIQRHGKPHTGKTFWHTVPVRHGYEPTTSLLLTTEPRSVDMLHSPPQQEAAEMKTWLRSEQTSSSDWCPSKWCEGAS